MLAMAVLVQPWLQYRQLQRQHNIMQIQANRLAQQQRAYDSFYVSLRANDTLLLERLAYHHLGLKPAGVEVIKVPYNDAGTISFATVGPESASTWSAPRPMSVEVATTRVADFSTDTLESWLHTPLPRVGSSYEIPQTRLVRLTTGLNQLVLTAAGLLCVAAGLLWSYNSKTQ